MRSRRRCVDAISSADGPPDASDQIVPSDAGASPDDPPTDDPRPLGLRGADSLLLVNTGDGPAVVVHASVTRAPANPAAAALPMLRDFHDFDEADLNDWSIAVPDPHFRALCGHLQGDLCRLSELVARWALEVGPMRAGQALAVRGGPLGQPLS